MVRELNWQCSDYDVVVYYKTWDDGTWALVGFWVDDGTSIGDEFRLLELEEAIRRRFGISSDGEACWILGTNIRHNAESKFIFISQKDYIENIGRKFNIENCRPVSTPLPQGVNYGAISRPETDEEKIEMANYPYRELVGSLMFASVVSRPNIAHSVNKLAQYSSNPGLSHWKLAIRILIYLYSTRDYELRLGGDALCLHAYSDADFAGDTEDRKSTGGYAIFLGMGTVSWSSKKQSTVALSSTESEYIALSEAAREVMWIRHFLEELDIFYDEPTFIFENNQGMIAFASNQRVICHMKHIEVKHHFIWHLIEIGTIQVVYRRTRDMTADILTKTLPLPTHFHHAQRLGVVNTSRLEEECGDDES